MGVEGEGGKREENYIERAGEEGRRNVSERERERERGIYAEVEVEERRKV